MSQEIESIIVSTPGVMGGRPRIRGTRVPVGAIVGWYKRGLSPEEIADQYDHVALAQVYAALTYYHVHQAEIEAEISAQEEEYERLMHMHYPQRA